MTRQTSPRSRLGRPITSTSSPSRGCRGSPSASLSDRLSKRARRGLETVTDFREFPRRQVDPLLLYFRALLMRGSERLLSVGTLLQRLQFSRQPLHGVGEFGQLSGDTRSVIGGCDCAAILPMPSGGSRRA